MKSNIEYFIDSFGNPCTRVGEIMKVISPEDTEIINEFLREKEDDFPEMYARLLQIYFGKRNYKFLMFRRAIRCNWPLMDKVPDRTDEGNYNCESFYCPLRGECPDENVICNPKLSTEFTKRELEIIKLIAENKSDAEIADDLYISVFTVKSHRQSIQKKADCKNKQGIAEYARKKNLL
jgi:DNA-binding CsgD family transcriptional regulator